MIGMRRYPNGSGELNPHRFGAGDYGYDPKDKCWKAMTPNGHLANLGAHDITEHEDKSISVSPSILVNYGPNKTVFHGYLERGVWRDC